VPCGGLGVAQSFHQLKARRPLGLRRHLGHALLRCCGRPDLHMHDAGCCRWISISRGYPPGHSTTYVRGPAAAALAAHLVNAALCGGGCGIGGHRRGRLAVDEPPQIKPRASYDDWRAPSLLAAQAALQPFAALKPFCNTVEHRRRTGRALPGPASGGCFQPHLQDVCGGLTCQVVK